MFVMEAEVSGRDRSLYIKVMSRYNGAYIAILVL
jgi:hypothetical protein